MEIDAQMVIKNLVEKIAQLELENTTLKVALELKNNETDDRQET